MAIDWGHLRAHKFAPDKPPSDWPKGVQPISVEGLSLFGVKDKRIYWDGDEIVVRRSLDLTPGQAFFGILGALGAFFAGAVAVLDWLGIDHLAKLTGG
jgi:hypothetical protein